MITRIAFGLAVMVALLAACTSPVGPLAKLEFDAEAVIDGSQLRYQLFGTNNWPGDVRLRELCRLDFYFQPALRIYDLPANGGALRWDLRRTRDPNVPCISLEPRFRFPAGERTGTGEWAVEVADILGDSIPAGTYRVGVLGHFEPRPPEVWAGEVTLTH